MMERLTNSDKEIPTLVDNAKYWLQVYFKLKDYEDLEEQGLLLRSPCKVGCIVYRINTGARKIFPLFVVELRFKMVGNYIREKIYCSDDVISKTVSRIYYKEDVGIKIFLSKHEAEQKLKEMESD